LECEELRSALEERTGVLTATQQERDVAIATLNKHGLAGQMTDHVTNHMTQLQHLRQQNEELHAVIRQMRQEIEQLAETPNGSKPHPIPPSQENRSILPTAGYIQYMENELVKIKSENRQLLERIQQVPPTGKPPTPSAASPGRGGSSPNSPRTAGTSSAGERRQHRGHLIALSDTIAGLQREKGALELAVVQLRSKVEELETSLSREQEQVGGM
jgi:predicted RNase H-like nuclease (RuvC/YqgF family)